SIRPGRTGAWAVGPPVCGTETGGIGPQRLMPILSFRATESSSTRSAGVSTHHGVRMRLRTLAMDMVTAVTVTAVSATRGTSARDTIRGTPPGVASPRPLGTRTALVEAVSADLAVAEPSAVAVSAAAAEASAVAAGEVSAVVGVSMAAEEEAVSMGVAAEGAVRV